MRNSSASLQFYGWLIVLTVITALIGTSLTGHAIRLFGFDEVLLVALGLLGVWLAPRTGFTDLFDAQVSNRQRFGRPLLVYTWVIHPEPVTELTPFMQPFPYSILLYSSGALYTDCLYRLIPLPLLMWLVGGLILRNPKTEWLFWVLALLSSLVEPIEQLLTDSPVLIAYSFGTGYAMNLIQAVFFRRYGFLACLSVRLGHYTLWHVGFGLWVQLH
jgi:hypothetical protein